MAFRYFVQGGVPNVVQYCKHLRSKPLINFIQERGSAKLYMKELKKLDSSFTGAMFGVKLSNFDYSNKTIDDISSIIETSNNKWTFDAEEYSTQKDYDTAVNQIIINCPNQVYKTYQCYLPNQLMRIEYDKSHLPPFGIKLVRGAYHRHEVKVQSPIFQLKEQTDKQYRDALKLCLQSHLPLMAATHNKEDVEYLIQYQKQTGTDKVSTAQLMGMSGDLQEQVRKSSLTHYQYIPYGTFTQAVPYLLRRLRENWQILQFL